MFRFCFAECCELQTKSLLLYRIWYYMTEEQKRLMAVFEVRLHDLISLCDERMQKIMELNKTLADKDEELGQALRKIQELNTRYDDVLTAKVVSVEEGEMKNAKMRLSKLVREVDKCIALLNE